MGQTRSAARIPPEEQSFQEGQAPCVGQLTSGEHPSVVYESSETLPMETQRLDSLQRYQILIWMILAWVSALAFAIGHHFFYSRFDQLRIDKTELSQGWIIRIGTGMAFVVQILFVVSATIACSQLQWLTTRSREFSVRQIDTIFSVPGNPLAFLESRLWLRYPALSMLAAIAW